MTASLFNIYAVPMALLLASAGMAAPKAVAESSRAGQATEVQFRYKPSAPAEQTYAEFRVTAERACKTPGPRLASLRKMDERCTKDLLKQVLDKVNRTDIAAIHASKVRG